MKRAIWKYAIKDAGETIHNIPAGSKLLHVAVQGTAPTIWVEVDPEVAAREIQTFIIAGTGWEYDINDWEWIGLYQDQGFVWHILHKRGGAPMRYR